MKPNNLRFHLHSAVLLCAAAALLRLASPACAQSGDITSSIPDQAEGVALNVPMIFTFSQAVNTAQAFVTFVQMSPSQGLVNVTKTWGAGNTQLTCTPDGGNWPPQAEIQWSVTVLSGGFPSMMGAGVFTTGTGGGTTDTDPPTLVSSFPTNNTTGVPLNRTIRFTFNEAMQPFESVQWSANLTPTKFTYDWVNANTLTCAYSENLPANATVTWKLNPTGSPALFKDAAGNALAADINAGSFTTSNTTTNDPCNPDPGDTSLGSFALFRQVMYVQTGSSAPVVDTNSLPRFIASLTSPTNGNPVTSAQLDVPPPVGSSLELTNFFVLGRLFSAFEEYDTQALLDASRPPGTYTLHVNRTAGAQSLTRTLAASDWPPIPQILNLPALQNVDTNNDLVVEWNGFTGAGESDSISFSLLLGSTPVYSAPDPCVPIALDKTATSITVPKSVLQAGATYDASLNYGHTGTFDTNSIPDIPSFAVTSKHLSFVVVTSGGVVPPKSPTIGSLGLTGRGLQAGITGASPNQSIQVQESTNLQPGSWSPVPTLQVQADASGNANLVFPVDTSGSKFYRLVTP